MSLSDFLKKKGWLGESHIGDEKSSQMEADLKGAGEALESPELSEKSSKEDQNPEEIYEVLEREILPAKIICPDCGGITLEGLEFCDKCGGELQ